MQLIGGVGTTLGSFNRSLQEIHTALLMEDFQI